MKRSYDSLAGNYVFGSNDFNHTEKGIQSRNGQKQQYTKIPYTVNLVERNFSPNGVSLVNPTKSGKSQHEDLITLASEIQKADEIVAATTCGKLKLIADQIRKLQKEAMDIMNDGLYQLDLHRIPCNFQKVPGTVYHLYERNSGEQYFSMLSPKDWNYSQPHKYIGSYRLNHDRTWTSTDSISESGPLDYVDINKFASIIRTNQSSLQNIISGSESYAESSKRYT